MSGKEEKSLETYHAKQKHPGCKKSARPIRSMYGTAQFKLDICTLVLVESLERFGVKLASCVRAHNSSTLIANPAML